MTEQRSSCVGTEDEYEFQFFGFSSKDIIEGIYNTVQCYIDKEIASIKSSILRKCPSGSGNAELYEEITKDLGKLYRQKSKEAIQHCEAEIKECFKIPPHVLLPGDECQKRQYSKQEEIALDSERQSIVDRIKKTKYLTAVLQSELTNWEDTIQDRLKYVDDFQKDVQQQVLDLNLIDTKLTVDN